MELEKKNNNYTVNLNNVNNFGNVYSNFVIAFRQYNSYSKYDMQGIYINLFYFILFI